MSTGRCGACGFDYGAVGPLDVPGLLAPAIDGFQRDLHDHDTPVLRARLRPETWSALEYACHVRDVLLVQRDRLYLALTEETPDCTPMHREERVALARYNSQRPALVAQQLRFAACLAGQAFTDTDRSAWNRGLIYHWPAPHRTDISGLAARTVHEALHHFADFQHARRRGHANILG